MTAKPQYPKRPASRPRGRGFRQTASLVQRQIRQAGESRGFAVSRLVTHWAEVVGDEIAETALPVKVSYGRKGFGATLTLLTTGARAPMLAMQKDTIRQRVNACYGYSAISHIAITQTAPVGFAEGQVAFQPAEPATKAPTEAVRNKARKVAEEIGNQDLRSALEMLAQNVLTHRTSKSEDL